MDKIKKHKTDSYKARNLLRLSESLETFAQVMHNFHEVRWRLDEQFVDGLCGRPSGRHYQPALKQHKYNEATVDITVPSPGLPSGESVWVYAATSNPCCTLLSHFEYTLFSVTYSWPLFANIWLHHKTRSAQHITMPPEENCHWRFRQDKTWIRIIGINSRKVR